MTNSQKPHVIMALTWVSGCHAAGRLAGEIASSVNIFHVHNM